MRNFQADPQAIMNAHAKSFSWAAKFLSSDAQPRIAQLYAYARFMDDLVDEPTLGSEAERLSLFEEHRQRAQGDVSDSTQSHHVGQMLRSLGVDQQVMRSFHDSLLTDIQPRQFQSFADVLGFAYGVAGTVGQMIRPILGAQPQTDRYAVALGMAMQLTNIARDVLEDAQRGRCYLPAQWLPEGWKLKDLLSGESAARQGAFIAIERLLMEAEHIYAFAEHGFDSIPKKNRRAIQVACHLYRGIGRKILRTGVPAYWQQRTHLSVWEKLKIISATIGSQANPAAKPAPDTLQAYQAVLQEIPGFPQALD